MGLITYYRYTFQSMLIQKFVLYCEKESAVRIECVVMVFFFAIPEFPCLLSLSKSEIVLMFSILIITYHFGNVLLFLPEFICLNINDL